MTLRDSFAEFGMEQLRLWILDRRPPLLFERSLRLQPEAIEARRCLFSFPVESLGDSACTEVLQICDAMSSPQSQMRAIQRFFPRSQHVHFGFEYSGNTTIGKCYLELGDFSGTDSQTSRLRFLGYKWSMNDDSVSVLSRYRALPHTIWAQLTNTMQPQVSEEFQSALNPLLNELQPRTGVQLTDLPLLEVEEEGSDRRSYDLNVYAHARPVGELADCIRAFGEVLHCDPSTLESWLDANGDTIVGHVAVGRSRTGQPFLTIYHSADVGAVLSS